MNTQLTEAPLEVSAVTTPESILATAGFVFAVVDRCPANDCAVCMSAAQPLAA